MTLEYVYNISIEGPRGQMLVDWGNAPGWAEAASGLLEAANRVSLIPKGMELGLPVCTVQLVDGRRWWLTSRVVRSINQSTGGQTEGIRLYGIGWRKDGIESRTWVYPDGTIEMGHNPSLAGVVLAAQPFVVPESEAMAEDDGGGG